MRHVRRWATSWVKAARRPSKRSARAIEPTASNADDRTTIVAPPSRCAIANLPVISSASPAPNERNQRRDEFAVARRTWLAICAAHVCILALGGSRVQAQPQPLELPLGNAFSALRAARNLPELAKMDGTWCGGPRLGPWTASDLYLRRLARREVPLRRTRIPRLGRRQCFWTDFETATIVLRRQYCIGELAANR